MSDTLERIKEQAREYVREGQTWPGDPAIEAVTQDVLCDLGIEQLVDAGELDFADARRAVESVLDG
jgi:hypothetical protein